MAGRLERGDVRLYQFATPDKLRPVLVLTRPESLSSLARVTVVSITSTVRGVPSEVPLSIGDGMKAPCAINLHNLQTVLQSHLGKRVAHLSSDKMLEVCSALRFALGCD